jgi:hypothetical protein
MIVLRLVDLTGLFSIHRGMDTFGVCISSSDSPSTWYVRLFNSIVSELPISKSALKYVRAELPVKMGIV